MKRIFLSLVVAITLVTTLAACNITTDLKSITVDTSNAQINYQLNEDFTSEGLKVSASFTSGSTESVLLSACKIDSSAFKKGVPGTYEIVVEYTKNNITQKAKYSVNVLEPELETLKIDTSKSITSFVLGDEFSSKGISVSVVYSDGTEAAYAGDDFVIDNSKFDNTKIGEYIINVSLVINNQTLSGSYKVTVETNVVTINNIQDFLDMREFQNAAGENSKQYTLACDLDLSDVELVPTTTIFTGTFNGGGHTIKNATFYQTASKQGLMFSKIDGALIENVNFFACTVVGGASETIAIIAGECNNTGATFKNIEFSCCTVDNGSQNYAALLVGRNESKAVTLNFENITVKNLTSVTSKQYVGCLIGDVIKNTVVNAKNCDLDVTLNASNNISVFSGRNRGATVNVSEAVVRLVLGDRTTASSNQAGIFADGNAVSTINASNVIVLKHDLVSVLSANADMMCGRNTNVDNATLTNIVYVIEDCEVSSTHEGVTTVSKENVNSNYIMSTINLSAEIWEADSNKIVKLVSATANTPSENAVVNSLTLITATVDKQFFEGQAISYAGLIVTAIYSDGCVIATDKYNTVIRNEEGTPIQEADFITSPIGKYIVSVEMDEASADYEVYIVKETGITIITDNVQKVYQVGDNVNVNELIAFVEISDGTHELLSANQYSVELKKANGDVVKTFVDTGVYTIIVSKGSFTVQYEVVVVEKEEDIQTIVNVYVDNSYVNGNKNEKGECQFSTIKGAIDYLVALNLDSQTIKNIYIAEGTYKEKITIDMPNTNLIGQSDDYQKVVLTYNAASGTSLLDETGTYGTDNSATLIVTSSAVNFYASNIYFINSFDYNNSKLANKQALAVRCDADKSIFYACGFSGHQDTLEAKKGRHYYYNCYIEGCVDFIFGNNATAVFEGCVINAVTRYSSTGEPEDNNGYVCAPKGYNTGSGTDTVKYNYVFLNCEFTADDDVLEGSMSVARPWGVDAGVVTINCEFSAAYSIEGYTGAIKSRYFDMSGNSPLDANFFEYNNSGDGAINTAVDGMKLLTETEAAEYTLVNIFAAENGQMKYDSEWTITKNPQDIIQELYIVYYELAKEEYEEKASFEASTKEAFKVTGNGITGYTVEKVEVVEKFYDENEAEITDVTLKAGNYVAKLFINDNVVASKNILVKPAEVENPKETKTLLASDATESTVARGTSYLEGLFTIYGKIDGSAVSVSGCTVNDGTTSYAKTMKISGGKAVVSTNEAELANCIKVVVGKAGTIKLVVSQKNATAKNAVTHMKLFGADAAAISTDTTELVTNDVTVMSVVSFELTEAGTYYIGADAGGFYLYSISYTYEVEKQPESKEVNKTLLASDATESTVARGTSYLEGLFTIYGKIDGSAVSVSDCTVNDGTTSYAKTMKISGGKAVVSTNETELANCIKVVVGKAGTIKLVVSQKNATAKNAVTHMKLFGADAAAISTDTTELVTNDVTVMSVVSFKLTEAGTYYIGADAGGFYLYSISYIYSE